MIVLESYRAFVPNTVSDAAKHLLREYTTIWQRVMQNHTENCSSQRHESIDTKAKCL
ncbi:MAG: hypothetical protein HRU34_24540 [Richelia sp.]|nr:hypothetical protein [Richelia sp.]